MFVDASAIVAMMIPEPDGLELTRILSAAHAPITSPIAVFEAAMAIYRKKRISIATAHHDVHFFLMTSGIEIVQITPAEGDAALLAYARYGKGQGHPAQLNMGDCFAYAVARNHGAGLLYRGSDFAGTDIGDTPAVD